MQTACNTLPLPSPDDPSLNAPILTARAPLDLASLDAMLDAETQCVPPPPTTPEGKLAALLSEDRGHKLVNCRKGGIIFKYADGHRAWRPMFPCNLTIACAHCAMEQADEQFSKYLGLDSLIAGLFIRITVPLEIPDNISPKVPFDTLMKSLRRLLPKAPTVAKIKPSSDTVEVLYCSGLSEAATTKLRKLYPSAVIRRHCLSNFPRELHRVLDADLFRTPEAAAAADAKYMKSRLLRVQGISREERSKLSLMRAIRDNLTEPSQDSSPQHEKSPKTFHHRTASGRLMPVPACPCGCGSPPTHFGRGKSVNDDSPDIHWVQVELASIQ